MELFGELVDGTRRELAVAGQNAVAKGENLVGGNGDGSRSRDGRIQERYGFREVPGRLWIPRVIDQGSGNGLAGFECDGVAVPVLSGPVELGFGGVGIGEIYL